MATGRGAARVLLLTAAMACVGCGFFAAGSAPCSKEEEACRPLVNAAQDAASARDAARDAGAASDAQLRDAASNVGDSGVESTGDGSVDPDAAASSACATKCEDDTPRCDPASGECVECLESKHCSGGKVCFEHTCVACIEDGDCKALGAARCSLKHECVPCAGIDDCEHFTKEKLCEAGKCVQCTPTDYTACTKNDMNQQLVCESKTRTCSVTASLRGAGLCEPCVSDAQCKLGMLCAKQMFGTATVGYFCLWQRGAAMGGAPTKCSDVKPFVSALGALSIDGTGGDVCALDQSTCPGFLAFRNDDVQCEPTPDAPDDSLCGAPGLADGYCRAYEVTASDTAYLCTMPCLTNLDCDNSCDTTVTPRVCTF